MIVIHAIGLHRAFVLNRVSDAAFAFFWDSFGFDRQIDSSVKSRPYSGLLYALFEFKLTERSHAEKRLNK